MISSDLEGADQRKSRQPTAKKGNSLGHCANNDNLNSVLEKIDTADALILGSPIYWGEISAQMRAFLERLLYQYTDFDKEQSLFTGKLKTGFIYTMNAPEGYINQVIEKYAGFLEIHFEYCGTVESTETLQVEDYSKYHLGFFDGDQRHERREKVFPEDCKKAFEFGKAMAQIVYLLRYKSNTPIKHPSLLSA